MPRSRSRSERSLDVARTGVLVALLAVAAQAVVPAGPVPFTLQTLVVALAALLLTPGQAAAAVGCYLLLGALGLSVFSALRGGLAVLLGPTGGFLYGFLLGAPVGALLRRALCPPAGARPARRVLAGDVAACAAVLLVPYATGVAHFAAVAALGGSPAGVAAALGACVAPFLLPDLLKMAAAVAVARALRRGVPALFGR